ncbi:MAG TPA: deoxyribodipyrimidine photo-lyase [Turneriella sp.]|nr:deoxyribodipyrimidine photo-lyase [Turneriella sp.]
MKKNGTGPHADRVAIHWFRRDLRLADNTALMAAAKSGLPVLPIFIFDKNILSRLRLKEDRRIAFIYETLVKLRESLLQHGGQLLVLHGKPEEVFASLAERFSIAAVYCNEDYEPYARERDAKVAKFCQERGIVFTSTKDHVVFAPHEVLKDDGTPYHVFTPYSRRWLAAFEQNRPVVQAGLPQCRWQPAEGDNAMPCLEELGFYPVSSLAPPALLDSAIIENYAATRDIPGIRGTTRLGIHLRFGTVSVRQLALVAQELSTKYLVELIWREFYQMILWYYPDTMSKAFRAQYAGLKFPGTEDDFRRWRDAETGYDLVDAGIRELVETGFMHNRVRMVVASFLTKHLLCDWRWGEHFFAQYLLDYELASNVGGWQWSAGIGVDAAPYFRIFNPAEQQKKYDADGAYVQRWLGTDSNFFGTPRPQPIVDHRFARERCLKFFSTARP